MFFFDPNSSRELAEKMELVIKGENIKFDGNIEKNIEGPCCNNWKELFEIILKK